MFMLNGCIETNIIMITNQWCEFNAAIFPTFTELQPNFYLAVLLYRAYKKTIRSIMESIKWA